MSLLPASIERIELKTTKKRLRHRFSHFKSIVVSVVMETRVLIQSAPKILCTLSPLPVMIHIKFDQDWPTGFRDIQV